MTATRPSDPREVGIFQEWDGACYYADGRLTRNQARWAACCEDGWGWYPGTVARRVWLRDCATDEALEVTEGWSDTFYVECVKTALGAVPMWKVTVGG